MKMHLVAVAALGMMFPSICYADDFVSDAIKGDNSEVTLGSLAESKASTPGVRQYGAMLRKDHATAKDQMSSLLTSAPPTDMMPEAADEEKKLQGLTGVRFDREFIHYMVDDHQKDIAKFEQESAKSDGRVSALAKKQLPVLRKHLATAQSLQKRL
jgi:putative membrane protein